MKKIVLLLTVIFTMLFAAVGMAADGGTLNRQQGTADVFISAFSGTAPEYAQFSRGFDATLKSKITEQVYADLQKQVNEKFGRMTECKFYSFQRFDNIDQLNYLAGFTKEKVVSIVLAFNKENKLLDFALTPIKQAEPKNAANNK